MISAKAANISSWWTDGVLCALFMTNTEQLHRYTALLMSGIFFPQFLLYRSHIFLVFHLLVYLFHLFLFNIAHFSPPSSVNLSFWFSSFSCYPISQTDGLLTAFFTCYPSFASFSLPLQGFWSSARISRSERWQADSEEGGWRREHHLHLRGQEQARGQQAADHHRRHWWVH